MDSAERQKAAVRKFREAFRNAPKNTPIHQLQEHAARPRPFKGPIWTSEVTIPAVSGAEGDGLRAKLWEVFQSKSDGSEVLDYPTAPTPLQGEWIAYRRGPAADLVRMSEREKFAQIERECDGPLTVFYLSGNGWLRDGLPGSRPLIQQLSEHSGCRVFTMNPRLAPQNTLPTIILDALIGYFYLRAPPPSALHAPVSPSTLILAGESGGATLHLAVLQFLQHFLRHDPAIRILDLDDPLALPRGCAFISPPMDILSALPAASANEGVDWMPERGPWFNSDFPADRLWPSSPPRAEIYVDASAMLHPLVQPTLCSESEWRGMPPMWIACGQERYADGIKYFVRAIDRAGVRVRFQEYQGMVHSFCVAMPWMKQSRDCIRGWGEACREMGEKGDRWESWAGSVEMGELRRTEVGFENLIGLEEREARRRMEARRDRLVTMVWRGPTAAQAKM